MKLSLDAQVCCAHAEKTTAQVRRLGSGASGSIGSAFSQVLLVGLPLTVLVGVAAVALWSLSGPPAPLPELKHVSKAHMSPQQQRFA